MWSKEKTIKEVEAIFESMSFSYSYQCSLLLQTIKDLLDENENLRSSCRNKCNTLKRK